MDHDTRGRLIAQSMVTELEKIANAAVTSSVRYGRGVVRRAAESTPMIAKIPGLGNIFAGGARKVYKAETSRGKRLIASGTVARRDAIRDAQRKVQNAARGGDHAGAEAARKDLRTARDISHGKRGREQTYDQYRHATETGKPGEDLGWQGRAAMKGVAGLGVGAAGVGGGALYLKKKRQEREQQFSGGY